MRFVKFEHLRVHGHSFTLHNGRLLLRRISDQHFSHFDHDEDDLKTKNKWRERFRALEHAFEHQSAGECLELLKDLYDDESLPDEISAELEPLLKTLKQKRGMITSYVFAQMDMDCYVDRVEDGHDRTPQDPDEPMCTIVWRNGQWIHVFGSAEETVKRLKGVTPAP